MDEDDDIVGLGLQSPYCPTCGRATLVGNSPEWLMTHFDGVIGAVLSALIAARRERRSCSLTELCRLIYHADPRGGPIYGPDVIQHAVANAQPDLLRLGWSIVGPMTTKNGYQLVPIETLEGII